MTAPLECSSGHRMTLLRDRADGAPLRFVLIVHAPGGPEMIAVGPFRSEYAATAWADLHVKGLGYDVLPLDPPGS